MILDFTSAKQQITCFYDLYSDKTWVLDQLERAQGPIYIISTHMINKEVLQAFHTLPSINRRIIKMVCEREREDCGE